VVLEIVKQILRLAVGFNYNVDDYFEID